MRRLFAALLASCASPGLQRAPPDGVPAVIVEQTPEGRASLLQAVTDLLEGVQPLLAADALTRESTLLLGRRRLEGRDTSEPDRFLLRKVGVQCVLLRERTGRQAVLVETRCTEER